MKMADRINVTPFDNGIVLYSMANRLLNLSAIGFRSGSINDLFGQSGINHLIEHLTCRRGVKYNERDIERLLNRYMGGTHGPDINIRCDRSSVLYGHDDLRRREYMWRCFDVFADFIKSVILDAHGAGPRVLDPEGLKVEKAAIHNEFRLRGTDIVEDHIFDLVHWHMYKNNPARKRIDCIPGDLRNIKLSQVRQFIRENYTTRNMFVILIGPKNNEAVQKVREYFGDLGDLTKFSREPLNPADYDAIPVLSGIRAFEFTRPGIRQHHVAVAFPAGNYLSKDSEVLDVLSAIWESRIEQRLREENTDFNAGIYHPEAWLPRTFTHGMIAAWFATVGDSKYVERAISIAVEECEKLKLDESGKFAEDCEDRREYLRDVYEQMFLWYPLNLCEAITEATCNGDVKLRHLLSYPNRLRQVTPRRLREAAQKYFTTPDRFVRIVVKPVTVPQDIIDKAPEEVRPYLLAINEDVDLRENS